MSEIKKEISWRAAEYEYIRKDLFWYLLVGGGALVITVFALWQKNFLFVVFVVLAAAVVIIFGRAKPRVFEFKINEDGVSIGSNNFHDYDRLQNFAIRSRLGRLDEIVLRRKSMINNYLRIPIDSKLLVEARKIMTKKLPEVEYQESLVDLFSEWLGF